jgi:hypothetical protein
MIPRDSASATTGNPQLAKPDYREWANARENLLYFLATYTPAIADAESQEMMLNAPRYLQQIEAYIRNPESRIASVLPTGENKQSLDILADLRDDIRLPSMDGRQTMPNLASIPEAVPSRDLLDRGAEAQVLADRMRLVRSC